MPDKAPPIIACPQCGKELHWDVANRYRPFCSERCKLIDLGKWAKEEYRVEQREEEPGSESSIPDSFRG